LNACPDDKVRRPQGEFVSEKREQTGWLSDLWGAANGPLLLLGAFVGAASGISAFARLFHVGLVGTFHDLVRFYRGLLRPIYEFVNLPQWPLDVPELAVDLFAVYAVLVGMALRATLLSRYREGMRDAQRLRAGRSPSRRWPGQIVIACLFLFPIIFATPVRDVLFGRGEIRRTFRVELDADFHDRIYAQMVRAFLAFISVPVAIIIFFVLNAYAPGPH